MGLDATVMCRCFQDGKTTALPFPRQWLEVDQEGYLNLKSQHDSDSNWGKQYHWQQSCCEHEGMKVASERIANWAGYRQFQSALGEVGWHLFPVLQEQLPNANGGLTPSEASAKALAELDVFVAAGEIGMKTVLVDTASGHALYEYIADYDGVFILSGKHGVHAGLSETEFFCVDAASGASLFRATHFRQFHRNGQAISGDRDGLTWQDVTTGANYESGIAICGQQIPWEDGQWQTPDGRCRFEYPAEFHVEQRPQLATDFGDIVAALRTVFEASVKTGNPVRWS